MELKKNVRGRAFSVLGGACNLFLGFYPEDPKTLSVGLTASAFDVNNTLLVRFSRARYTKFGPLPTSSGPLRSHPVHLRTSFLIGAFWGVQMAAIAVR